MSYEAIGWVRKTSLRGSRTEHEQKWLTVPTDDREAARRAFTELGFDVRGLTILDQQEATAHAERIGR